MLLGIVIVGNGPREIDIWRIRCLKYGYVKFVWWDCKALRRRQQVRGVGDGILLEIIAEGKIAEHLEERVVAFGETDVFEVVVLAARAHAFLRTRRPRVIALFEAEENILELVHPRIRKQQGSVPMRHQRRAPHAPVPLAISAFLPLKKLQKLLPYFVACHSSLGRNRGFMLKVSQRHRRAAITACP